MELDRNDGTKGTCLSFEQADLLPQTSLCDHVHISQSKKHRVDLHWFVNERRNDPAFHVSIIVSLSVWTSRQLTHIRTFFLVSRHISWRECWATHSPERMIALPTRNWIPWLLWVITFIVTKSYESTILCMMVAGIRTRWTYETMLILWCFLMRQMPLIHIPFGMVGSLEFFMSVFAIFSMDITPPRYDTSHSSMCAGSVVILVSTWVSDTSDIHRLGSMTLNMHSPSSILIRSFGVYTLSRGLLMRSHQIP